MEGDQQAYYVAVYRAKHAMDAIVAQEQAAEAKARSKPGKHDWKR